MATVYEKLLRSDYSRLPESVRRALVSAPILSVPVEPWRNGFRVADTSLVERPAPRALVPKLGIKSWRDSGTLGVIYAGVSLRVMLAVLLQKPTPAQTLAARAWTRTETPLLVHLAPYVDFSDISEARYLVLAGECRRISVCLRGDTAKGFNAAEPQLAHVAVQAATRLGGEGWIVDLALTSAGSIRLVEVNPALTPAEINEITA